MEMDRRVSALKKEDNNKMCNFLVLAFYCNILFSFLCAFYLPVHFRENQQKVLIVFIVPYLANKTQKLY